jgi:hypothetical protein
MFFKNRNNMKQIYSRYWRLGIPILLLMASCQTDNNAGPTPKHVDGWAPVYSTDKAAYTISATSPAPITNGGKIYVRGSELYQVETGKGIHVLDISQPSNPQKKKFISIMGAQEMAIKGGYLYANNLNDLVVIDIGNPEAVTEVGRMKNLFHMVDQSYPPEDGWFECIDATKGTVVGWEQRNLSKPKCRRN